MKGVAVCVLSQVPDRWQDLESALGDTPPELPLLPLCAYPLVRSPAQLSTAPKATGVRIKCTCGAAGGGGRG